MDGNDTEFKLLIHRTGDSGIRSRGPLQQRPFREESPCLAVQRCGRHLCTGGRLPSLFTGPLPLPALRHRVFPEKVVRGPTSPAGPDHERRFPPGWVDETVVVDESRVEGDAISIERDRGELEVQGVVVPLIITHLGVQSEGKSPAVTRSPRN